MELYIGFVLFADWLSRIIVRYRIQRSFQKSLELDELIETEIILLLSRKTIPSFGVDTGEIRDFLLCNQKLQILEDFSMTDMEEYFLFPLMDQGRIKGKRYHGKLCDSGNEMYFFFWKLVDMKELCRKNV